MSQHSKTTFPKQLLHPRHWFMWIVIGFLYSLSKLPYRCQLSVGRVLGKLAYWLLPRRRHITDVNLKLCFPELDAKQRKQLLKENYVASGIAILETAMAWWWPKEKILSVWHTEGFHHIENALASGKGVLMLGLHLTTLEFVARYAGLTIPMYVTYREQKNAVVDYLLRRNRHYSLMKIIHRHDIREVVKQLKNKKIVWYAADQDYGRKYSVFAPFFGVSAATITVPSRYVKMSDAVVIMAAYYRLPNGRYRLVFSPAVENFPSGDDVQDATCLNQEIEKLIRVAPEQYFWAHRRFKTRPEGEPKFY